MKGRLLKNVNLIILSIFSCLILKSCNKVLDMAPDGYFSIEDVFKENVKVEAFLNSCYNQIPAKGLRYFFWMRGPVVWSDDAWDTDSESEPTLMTGRLYNGDASAGNHPITNFLVDAGNGNYWDSFWVAIRNCSVFIKNIDEATVNNESDRRRWKAEAHLLRAYYYHELLKWFGPTLPIMAEPMDFDSDFSKIEKPSYYEIAQFIIKDCNVALETPELPWTITTQGEHHRIPKSVAEAIKSKVILFAASAQNNAGQNYWQEAYEMNKESLANLKNNGYELYNKVNYPQTYLSELSYIGPTANEKASLYNEYFNQGMQFSGNRIDKETIWQSRDWQGPVHTMDGIGAQDGYKTGTCPSQELVDSYETIDGEPILDLSKPYLDEKHTQPNYNKQNKIYNPEDPYANRDPRFYASIYYNGSKRYAFWNFSESEASHENFPAPMGARTRIIATYVGEPQTGIDRLVRRATRTGYYGRKFLHPNSGTNNPVSGANAKLFRLAEVILNFAEAAAEAGHLEEARQALNEIRERVGMPKVAGNLSKEMLILRIRNERRVELAFEENRYFDVRRWAKPGEGLEKTDKWITAMEITRHADGSFSYSRRPVRDVERLCYSKAFIWLPIPLSEANRLQSITGKNWQNPGW